MKSNRFHLCFALVCAALVASPALAADAGGGNSIEPRADKILRLASKYLTSVERFTFHVKALHEVVLDGGQKLQFERRGQVAARRPNGVWADVFGEIGHYRLWYDGKQMTFLNVNDGTYSGFPVPDTIDAAFDFAAEEYGYTPPLVDLLYSDPYAILIEVVEKGFYAGLQEVRGILCHHLAFSHPDIDWQIWVEDGVQPLPRKVVITYKNEPGVPQYIAYIDDWDLAPSFPDSLFEPLLPEGAVKTEFETLREKAKRDQ